IDVNPNPEVFGAGSPGQATYGWQVPNPGGLPLVGNAGFSLTVEVEAGNPTPGFVWFGLALDPEPDTVQGATLLLEPTLIVTGVALPFPGPMTLALPIPNQPALVGATLFAQSFHLESGAELAASPAIG